MTGGAVPRCPADCAPSHGCAVTRAGGGCLRPGQRQGWGPSRLRPLQACTLSWAVAASASVGSSAGAGGAGAGARWGPVGGGEGCSSPGGPARAPGSSQPAAATLRLGESRSGPFKSRVSVSYSPLVSLTGFHPG